MVDPSPIEGGQDRLVKYSIHGIIHGEPIDLKKHGFKVEIKAPTFHDMRIDENPKGVSMRFLLDL